MTCLRRCCNRRRQVQTRAFNDNNFIPSAIEVIYPNTQLVEATAPLLFLQTNYNTGVSFTTNTDDLGANIVASGVYKISFSGVVTTDQNQTIGLAITANNETLPASVISQYITTDGPQTVQTSAIFKLLSPPANIGVVNTGNENFSVTNAKLDIVRIGNF